MNGSRSVRGFVLALLGYAGVRTAILWTPDLHPAPIVTVAAARTLAQTRRDAAVPNLLVTKPARVTPTLLLAETQTRPAQSWRLAIAHPLTNAAAPPPVTASRAVPTPVGRTSASDRPKAPVELASPPSQAPLGLASPNIRFASNWSGYAYLFHRTDRTGPATLAPAGQIGGSQAAARIAYRLPDTPIALAARIATPLRETRQAEVAAGLDLLPLPNLRISVERRIAIGRDGRDAFAAYAAGGLYRAIAPRLELDGYAQAGIVGVRRRDLFGDGALRIHHRTAIGATTDLRLGAGAWGAAQPGAARLDIGPRLAVTTRTARLPVTLAVEGRLRVAGRARPGNGIALTLASDF
ncbi:hypothetical protein [Sphingomonas prati]|uniref:Uncharacterized protein n=1 Tax=Sphingomonas prati TaxID=1843237 RepID=A0A7W9BSC6_9SPHN|nr:hypothetical protein [Sphingomonas prati]MBB5729262.1 hypothetical protein [Sphingomonas prati]GGE83889.1 hypothetical protein GCM10011404_15660 [Sphingomonas prati]